MKRLACLFLAVLLLLSGCAKPGEKASAPSVVVKTDYSKYTPAESKAAFPICTGVTDLSPGNYGAIYPFVGDLLLTWFGEHQLYGLRDETGNVIVDPVYSYVELYEGGGDVVWALGKVCPDGEYNYFYDYTLASLDGSVVLEKHYLQIHQDGELLFASYQDEKGNTCYDIYNTKLQLVTTSQELTAHIPDSTLSLLYIYYAEEMFRLFFSNKQNYYIYYYTNLDGSQVLGPYESGKDFACGYAIVEDEKGEYFIDKKGKLLGGKRYRPMYWYDGFENGVAYIVRSDYDHFGCIINTQGKVILDCELACSFDISEYAIELTLSDYNLTGYYSFDGELLFPNYYPFEEDGIQDFAGYFPSAWRYLGEAVFLDWENLTLYNVESGKTMQLSQGEYNHDYSYFHEGLPYFYIQTLTDHDDSYENMEYHFYLLNKDLEVLLSLDGGYFYFLEDSITKESYFLLFDQESYTLYDKDLNFLAELPGNENQRPPMICGGQIVCTDGRYGLCYDMQGQETFRYLLQGMMD